MSAPALVLLSEGSLDHHNAGVMHALRKGLQERRPDLEVSVAFHRHQPPSAFQSVAALSHRGVKEVVFVPVSLTAAVEEEGTADIVARVALAYPKLTFSLARPIGPASDLLTILDARVRSALRLQGARQVDALVLAAPKAGDIRGVWLMQRRARQWSAHHKIPCTVAFNDNRGPDTSMAITSLRTEGRRHIAVGSLWYGPDESYRAHYLSAIECGAIAVSEPIGLEPRLLELAVDRYAFAAMGVGTQWSGAEPIQLAN